MAARPDPLRERRWFFVLKHAGGTTRGARRSTRFAPEKSRRCADSTENLKSTWPVLVKRRATRTDVVERCYLRSWLPASRGRHPAVLLEVGAASVGMEVVPRGKRRWPPQIGAPRASAAPLGIIKRAPALSAGRRSRRTPLSPTSVRQHLASDRRTTPFPKSWTSIPAQTRNGTREREAGRLLQRAVPLALRRASGRAGARAGCLPKGTAPHGRPEPSDRDHQGRSLALPTGAPCGSFHGSLTNGCLLNVLHGRPTMRWC